MSNTGSITVAVRVRPPTSWEAARLPEPPSFDSIIRGDGTLSSPRKAGFSSCRDIIENADDRILTFDPPDRDAARAFSERGFLPPGSKRYKDRRFMFDRVFDGQASQIQVYESTTRPLLDGLLDGYNATVFAYGATGCGKTYTISGVDSDPGLVYLTMADLFQRIEDRKDETLFEVAVTFLEIYNEEIRDLLLEPGTSCPRGGLAIREDRHVKVVNLTELHPSNADEVKGIVMLGNRRRTQSPTHANETSSRSHAVLQVHVTQAPRTASTTETRTVATLSIIDLAGSERASATKNMGERMVEGANINKSLLALGNCINALCESGGTTRHIPYRNSKLTRLLKFSLGGNCKTVMIVCIAPTSIHFEDTYNALLYAERATKIKTRVVTRNILNVNRHVGQYVEAINRLNDEVAQLKAKLSGRIDGEETIMRRKRMEALQEVERAKADIQAKCSQNTTVIVEGASSEANLEVAKLMLAAIHSPTTIRDEDRALMPADFELGKATLGVLVAPQEAILHPGSPTNARLAKAKNADNLLDATLRAVTERRTGRLDEISIENVRLEAQCHRNEIERLKAGARCQVYKDALAQQIQRVSNLANLLIGSTVTMRASANKLQFNLDPVIHSIGQTLRDNADSYDKTFTGLASSSTPQLLDPRFIDEHRSFSKWTPPVNAGRISLSSKPRGTQRSSIASSPRKLHRSPRKSIRDSMPRTSKPLSKRTLAGEKKTVHWKDEDVAELSSPKNSDTMIQSSFRSTQTSLQAASESEWEDEKTDDSLQLSFTSAPRLKATANHKRIRSNRLDPGFLKSKASALGSLEEAVEIAEVMPLSDKLNQIPSTSTLALDKYPVPKSRGVNSERRVPSTPIFAKTSRRSSNVGPMRVSRGRRRSSSLSDAMSLSTSENYKPNIAAGVRRTAAYGAKSSSPPLVFRSGSRSLPISMTGPPQNDPALGIINSEVSGDLSFKGSKPMWR